MTLILFAHLIDSNEQLNKSLIEQILDKIKYHLTLRPILDIIRELFAHRDRPGIEK